MDQLNGHLLRGRNLRIRYAVHNAKSQKEPDNGPSVINSVYVRFSTPQINSAVTEEMLHNVFDHFGSVLDISIKESSNDVRTNRHSGYGFVHFTGDDAGVAAAFQAVSAVHNATLEGVTYSVELSKNLLKQFSPHTDSGNTGGAATHLTHGMLEESLMRVQHNQQHQQAGYGNSYQQQQSPHHGHSSGYNSSHSGTVSPHAGSGGGSLHHSHASSPHNAAQQQHHQQFANYGPSAALYDTSNHSHMQQPLAHAPFPSHSSPHGSSLHHRSPSNGLGGLPAGAGRIITGGSGAPSPTAAGAGFYGSSSRSPHNTAGGVYELQQQPHAEQQMSSPRFGGAALMQQQHQGQGQLGSHSQSPYSRSGGSTSGYHPSARQGSFGSNSGPNSLANTPTEFQRQQMQMQQQQYGQQYQQQPGMMDGDSFLQQQQQQQQSLYGTQQEQQSLLHRQLMRQQSGGNTLQAGLNELSHLKPTPLDLSGDGTSLQMQQHHLQQTQLQKQQQLQHHLMLQHVHGSHHHHMQPGQGSISGGSVASHSSNSEASRLSGPDGFLNSSALNGASGTRHHRTNSESSFGSASTLSVSPMGPGGLAMMHAHQTERSRLQAANQPQPPSISPHNHHGHGHLLSNSLEINLGGLSAGIGAVGMSSNSSVASHPSNGSGSHHWDVENTFLCRPGDKPPTPLSGRAAVSPSNATINSLKPSHPHLSAGANTQQMMLNGSGGVQHTSTCSTPTNNLFSQSRILSSTSSGGCGSGSSPKMANILTRGIPVMETSILSPTAASIAATQSQGQGSMGGGLSPTANSSAVLTGLGMRSSHNISPPTPPVGGILSMAGSLTSVGSSANSISGGGGQQALTASSAMPRGAAGLPLSRSSSINSTTTAQTNTSTFSGTGTTSPALPGGHAAAHGVNHLLANTGVPTPPPPPSLQPYQGSKAGLRPELEILSSHSFRSEFNNNGPLSGLSNATTDHESHFTFSGSSSKSYGGGSILASGGGLDNGLGLMSRETSLRFNSHSTSQGSLLPFGAHSSSQYGSQYMGLSAGASASFSQQNNNKESLPSLTPESLERHTQMYENLQYSRSADFSMPNSFYTSGSESVDPATATANMTLSQKRQSMNLRQLSVRSDFSSSPNSGHEEGAAAAAQVHSLDDDMDFHLSPTGQESASKTFFGGSALAGPIGVADRSALQDQNSLHQQQANNNRYSSVRGAQLSLHSSGPLEVGVPSPHGSSTLEGSWDAETSPFPMYSDGSQHSQSDNHSSSRSPQRGHLPPNMFSYLDVGNNGKPPVPTNGMVNAVWPHSPLSAGIPGSSSSESGAEGPSFTPPVRRSSTESDIGSVSGAMYGEDPDNEMSKYKDSRPVSISSNASNDSCSVLAGIALMNMNSLTSMTSFNSDDLRQLSRADSAQNMRETSDLSLPSMPSHLSSTETSFEGVQKQMSSESNISVASAGSATNLKLHKSKQLPLTHFFKRAGGGNGNDEAVSALQATSSDSNEASAVTTGEAVC